MATKATFFRIQSILYKADVLRWNRKVYIPYGFHLLTTEYLFDKVHLNGLYGYLGLFYETL